jgi:ParB-like chromosome segregation protein Spo0J
MGNARTEVEVKTYVEKIDKLIASDINPRKINRKQYEALKKSLKDFPEMKQLREIVVDENLTILGGHQRIYALKDLGYSDVTVKQVTGLTEKQKREFIIKDNTASGEWDSDVLANRWDLEELENWDMPKFALAGYDDEQEKSTGDKTKEPKLVDCPNCGEQFEV